MNPFDDIYKKCNRDNVWSIPRFPYCIDIELTNYCMFSCKMCSTGNRKSKRKKGFMRNDVFQQIFAEIKDIVQKYNLDLGIRFIRWGEPIMHNKWLSYAKLLKDIGCLLHINTNGYLLEKHHYEELCNSFDSIKFSFQGINRYEYFDVRGIDYFDRLIEKIFGLYDYKEKYKKDIFIHIASTVDVIDESAFYFRNKMNKICDRITIGKTIWDGDFDNIPLRKRIYNRCTEVFSKLSIDWDGDIIACCSDNFKSMKLGNIMAKSLYDIWNHSYKLSNIRDDLFNDRHYKYDICRQCVDYMNIKKLKRENAIRNNGK